MPANPKARASHRANAAFCIPAAPIHLSPAMLSSSISQLDQSSTNFLGEETPRLCDPGCVWTLLLLSVCSPNNIQEAGVSHPGPPSRALSLLSGVPCPASRSYGFIQGDEWDGRGTEQQVWWPVKVSPLAERCYGGMLWRGWMELWGQRKGARGA